MSTSSRSWGVVSFVWALWALSFAATAGVAPAAEPRSESPQATEGRRVGDATPADDAIAALVAFLDRDENPARGEGEKASHGDRDDRRAGPPGKRGGERGRGRRGEPEGRAEASRGRAPEHARAESRPVPPGRPSPRRPFDDGPPRAARPEGPQGGEPQVRAFAFQLGPDGVANQLAPGMIGAGPGPDGARHGERRQITVHVDGGAIKLDGLPGMIAALGGPGGPHPGPDAHAEVRQMLDRILDKVNAIESRLGGPGAPPHPGQPPHQPGPHGPGPQGPGPHQPGPGPQMMNPPPPPQPVGPQPHPGHPGPGPQGPPQHQGPIHGGINPDEIHRRFEEHARDLHARMEEMGRRLKEQVMAGGGEQMKQAHHKLAETHERVQEAFQDVRRRFAEQQERLERLEQEVRRMREELERRGAGGEQPPRKPVSIDGAPTL